MTDFQFNVLWAEALASADRDAFISDAALSSIWGDAPDAAIPDDRLQQLGQLWDAAHLTVKEIRAATGLSQAAFAQRFCIPRRTVENWESGTNTCPAYVRLLLAQAVGLHERG
jgi:DNA-binding transcriptional regulator YiaG|nr:MAG TPA: putative transcriptional regulator [Caudoviricetes sp.]